MNKCHIERAQRVKYLGLQAFTTAGWLCKAALIINKKRAANVAHGLLFYF
jgi:hypothetical protein